MSDKTKDLLPCPFCGGEASSSGTVSYSDKHEAWFSDGTRITKAFYCNCIACGISNRGLLGQQTRDKAISAWNIRASATSAPEQPAVTRPKNSQAWAGMGGAIAFHLIERHSDNWADAEMMMDEWRLANTPATPQPAKSCKWLESDPWGEMPNTYESSCGEAWSFIEGDAVENGIKFCHGCGKPVIVEPFTPQPAEGA